MPTRWLRFSLLLSLWALFVLAPAAAQNSVDLTPDKDNTLYEDNSGAVSNGAGMHLFAGTTGGRGSGIRRALLRFDLDGVLPADATLNSAELVMRMSRTASGNQDVSLHRVTTDWGEGSSLASGNGGQGGPAQSDDATWLHTFFSNSLWSSPGGAFDATPSATTSVGSTGSYTWSGAGLTADVQAWLDDPSSNFGWIVVGNENTGGTAKRFDSRESGNPPTLTLSFSTSVATDDPAEIPGGMRLLGNHPNPFTTASTITYELAALQPVTLAVYDVLGRRVATLVDGVKTPGVHRVDFEAGMLPPGIYVYRLTAGQWVQHRTMTLLR